MIVTNAQNSTEKVQSQTYLDVVAEMLERHIANYEYQNNRMANRLHSFNEEPTPIAEGESPHKVAARGTAVTLTRLLEHFEKEISRHNELNDRLSFIF